jgi:RNA polymerase sigma factor (sigma-70 family)
VRPRPLTPGQRDLAERYWPLARSLAGRYARVYPRLAEDLLDATVDRLLHGAATFDPDRGVHVGTYLWRQCELGCLDVVRAARRRRRPEPLDPEGPTLARLADDKPSAESGVADRDELDWYLGRLSRQESEPLRLRVDAGLDGPRIAERLGVPVHLVWKRERLAIRRLRGF